MNESDDANDQACLEVSVITTLSSSGLCIFALE
jgi:hypothetical protein